MDGDVINQYVDFWKIAHFGIGHDNELRGVWGGGGCLFCFRGRV